MFSMLEVANLVGNPKQAEPHEADQTLPQTATALQGILLVA